MIAGNIETQQVPPVVGSGRLSESRAFWLFLVASASLLIVVGLQAGLLLGVLITFMMWLLSKPRMISRYPTVAAVMAQGAGLFWILTVIATLRFFVVEPYHVASSSMFPTLQIGDKILVNRFAYGIRVPLSNSTLIPIGEPKRGDVALFIHRSSQAAETTYVKRIIGLPGDLVVYWDKQLWINGEKVEKEPQSRDECFTEQGKPYCGQVVSEKIGDVQFDTLIMAGKKPVKREMVQSFSGRESCSFDLNGAGFTCRVPEGKYVVIGDDRDMSADSRYWGFVGEKDLLGRASRVMFNSSEWSRNFFNTGRL